MTIKRRTLIVAVAMIGGYVVVVDRAFRRQERETEERLAELERQGLWSSTPEPVA